MIEVTGISPRDLPHLARIWSQALAKLGAPCGLTGREVEEHVLLHGGEPRAVLAIDPAGWLAARADGVLVGFAHATVGRLRQDDPETLRGVLRALVTADDAPEGTVALLVRAADAYFERKSRLDGIVAFHVETGYPRIACGRGALLGDAPWPVMTALGDRGYQLVRRWLFFERPLSEMLPERLPQLSGLELHWQEDVADGLGLVVHSTEGEPVAEARFLRFPQGEDCPEPPMAGLYRFEVVPERRRKGVGLWLLQRSMNHLLARGVRRLCVDAPHEDRLTQTRLLRLGFRESPLRGYSYEKRDPSARPAPTPHGRSYV
jgi:GNAT superfamily N-acetyltransferase